MPSLLERVEALEERQGLLMQCGITGETVETSWQILGLRKELAEAKAEIERLETRCNRWAQRAHTAESVAKIGRAIRAMKEASCLYRFRGGRFGVGLYLTPGGWTSLGRPASLDPAEALRSIQKEVGDDEG